MKTWMIFHPGAGYSTDWRGDDVECYDTFGAALRAFDRLPDSYYPCAYPDAPEGEGAEGWVFFYDPRNPENPDGPLSFDVYPDRIISYGPREGVRWTRA